MRWIDAGNLPEEFVALIDTLGPGENLVVARDGRPIASVSGAPDVFRTGNTGERSSPTVKDVTVVATAMDLSPSARASLSEKLGPDYIVLDMHSAPKSADVLLTPPVSPQLLGHLREIFPQAKLIIAEIEDRELGVVYQGPVHRLLNAGADTYLPPSTIPHLAKRLDHAVTQLNQLTGGTSEPLTIDTPLDRNSLES